MRARLQLARWPLWVVLIALAAVATAQPAGNDQAAQKPAADPADTARRAIALATYKGGQITVGDLEDAIAEQSPFMRKRYLNDASKQKLLKKQLRFVLLAQEAERKGFGSNHVVVQSVKQNAVQQLMKREFDDKITVATITEDEVAKHYQENLAEFMRPAMRRASQILVASLAQAKAVLAQAKTMDMRQFRQLARSKSTDQATKLRGGDLRYFNAEGKVRGEDGKRIPVEIARAAFALKDVGDTAPAPIEIEGGFAIVKLTGKRAASSRSIEQAGETIRMRLWRAKRQEAIDKFLASLKAEHKPELHPELISAIKFAPETPVAKGRGIPPGFPTDKGKAAAQPD